MNLEPSVEFAVQLNNKRLLTVDKNPPSLPSFPLLRTVLWTPAEDDELRERVAISDRSHVLPANRCYDIDTSIYEYFRYLFFEPIGDPYLDKEPFIQQVDEALDEAREVAEDLGLAAQVGTDL